MGGVVHTHCPPLRQASRARFEPFPGRWAGLTLTPNLPVLYCPRFGNPSCLNRLPSRAGNFAITIKRITFTGIRHETYIPASTSQAQERTRISQAHVHARRTPRPQASSRQGSQASLGVARSSAPRWTRPGRREGRDGVYARFPCRGSFGTATMAAARSSHATQSSFFELRPILTYCGWAWWQAAK